MIILFLSIENKITKLLKDLQNIVNINLYTQSNKEIIEYYQKNYRQNDIILAFLLFIVFNLRTLPTNS